VAEGGHHPGCRLAPGAWSRGDQGPLATAAIREAKNRDKVVEEIEEGRRGRGAGAGRGGGGAGLAFIGATKSVGSSGRGGRSAGGRRRRAGSSEVVYGTVPDGVTDVRSFKIGSGSPGRGPPGVRTRRRPPRSAGSATTSPTSSRTSEPRASRSGGRGRGERHLTGGPSSVAVARVRDDGAGGKGALQRRDGWTSAKRFELDSRPGQACFPAGVLLLEKFSQMLGPAAGRSAREAFARGIILTPG